MGSSLLDAVLDSVEASKGSSHSLVGGLVIDVGKLERGDGLGFDNLNSSLERLGEHEILVKRLFEDLVVESLLAVVVLFSFSNEILSTLCIDHSVLIVGIGDFLGSLGSFETVLLSLLLVNKVYTLFLLVVLVRSGIFENGKICSSVGSFFHDHSLLFSSLFPDVTESLIENLVELLDFGIVVALKFGHGDFLNLSKLLEFSSDGHLDTFSLITHLFSVISLKIFKDRTGGDKDLGDLDRLEVDTPSIADLLHLLFGFFTDLSAFSQALFQGRVSDLVTDDGASLLLKVVVGGLRVG